MDNSLNTTCSQCRDQDPLGFAITFAFQPIIDIEQHDVYAYEALVRGTEGQGAGFILSRVTEDNRYPFDQLCRTTAIELATKLGIKTRLSINFLPNAVYRPAACIRKTLAAADQFGFPLGNLIFEVTESEPVRDPQHLSEIFNEYRSRGFITAIDDFGAGYAGLNLLTQFKPQVIKLDMDLCQGVSTDEGKRIITQGVITTAKALGIKVVAEGIETPEDFRVLAQLGVNLFQGYLFSKPAIEQLVVPDIHEIKKLLQ